MMQKLALLFTDGGVKFLLSKNKNVLEEGAFFADEEAGYQYFKIKLDEILSKNKVEEIEVVSAVNHFALTPVGFADDDFGYDLISLNSRIDKELEEIKIDANKKYGVQFYYSFSKNFYQTVVDKNLPCSFNFSGEKFLNLLKPKHLYEIHIHLLSRQMEFFCLKNRKPELYNNLNASYEIDFLYFIIFSLKKTGFDFQQTHFYIYGETSEYETFISELNKLTDNMEIIFENSPKKIFLL